MNVSEARRVIESLRKGIPPDGYVSHFTVGRKFEIDQLRVKLLNKQSGALLLKANYGSGKTHLLRFIREAALQEGFAVSSVTLDARSAVRFNRMDQILGAIWRGLEVPNVPQRKGVRPFFDLVCQHIEESKANNDGQPFWHRLTNNWRWDFSEALDAPALFVALRAWSTGIAAVHDRVEDWLFQPWTYYSQRKPLYLKLVDQLRAYFRDPRPEWNFYDTKAGLFNFQLQDYAQSWAALRDIETLACAARLRGLIVLFDEFEDVLYNIRNIAHQQSAFWNLFQFYSGKQFSGMTFFAVTPGFVEKCKSRLMTKQISDYDFGRFDKLPTFEMSPLTVVNLYRLAKKILDAHAIAFEWEPNRLLPQDALKDLVSKVSSAPIQDRTRHTIREVVKVLDRAYEDAE